MLTPFMNFGFEALAGRTYLWEGVGSYLAAAATAAGWRGLPALPPNTPGVDASGGIIGSCVEAARSHPVCHGVVGQPMWELAAASSRLLAQLATSGAQHVVTAATGDHLLSQLLHVLHLELTSWQLPAALLNPPPAIPYPKHQPPHPVQLGADSSANVAAGGVQDALNVQHVGRVDLTPILQVLQAVWLEEGANVAHVHNVRHALQCHLSRDALLLQAFVRKLARISLHLDCMCA